MSAFLAATAAGEDVSALGGYAYDSSNGVEVFYDPDIYGPSLVGAFFSTLPAADGFEIRFSGRTAAGVVAEKAVGFDVGMDSIPTGTYGVQIFTNKGDKVCDCNLSVTEDGQRAARQMSAYIGRGHDDVNNADVLYAPDIFPLSIVTISLSSMPRYDALDVQFGDDVLIESIDRAKTLFIDAVDMTVTERIPDGKYQITVWTVNADTEDREVVCSAILDISSAPSPIPIPSIDDLMSWLPYILIALIAGVAVAAFVIVRRRRGTYIEDDDSY